MGFAGAHPLRNGAPPVRVSRRRKRHATGAAAGSVAPSIGAVRCVHLSVKHSSSQSSKQSVSYRLSIDSTRRKRPISVLAGFRFLGGSRPPTASCCAVHTIACPHSRASTHTVVPFCWRRPRWRYALLRTLAHTLASAPGACVFSRCVCCRRRLFFFLLDFFFFFFLFLSLPGLSCFCLVLSFFSV